MVLIFGFLRRDMSYGFLSFLLETCRNCWDLLLSLSVSLCVRVFGTPHLSLPSLRTNLSFFFLFFKQLDSFYTKRLPNSVLT